MSPRTPNARAYLQAPPREARLTDGDLGGALQRLLDEERRKAFASGREAGAREMLAGAAGVLNQATERLDEARTEALAALGSDAIELAMEIARQILRHEIPEGSYDLERIVRDTLALSGTGRGIVTVHLHPADAASLAEVRFRTGTTIEADEGVTRGSVHIATPHGLLVRDIDEVLGSIGEALRGETP